MARLARCDNDECRKETTDMSGWINIQVYPGMGSTHPSMWVPLSEVIILEVCSWACVAAVSMDKALGG